jgi:hypothetical protein
MTITLGLVVAYAVPDEHERLLDLHLTRIGRHTTVPYLIHGSTNRAGFRCGRRLAACPKVRLHELPSTSLTGADEHSYYLEQLIPRAFAAGASHVAILHVDSFPIRDGWVEACVSHLSPACPFVTTDGVDTACLLFSRDFYEAHRPPLLLSAVRLESAAYKAFVRATGVAIRHSGTGFAFTAYERGLCWHALPRSAGEPLGASVYANRLFHLKGAQSLARQLRHDPRVQPTAGVPWILRRTGRRRFEQILGEVRRLIPAPVRPIVRARLARPLERLIDGPRHAWHATERDQLLANPDAFIDALTG